VRYMGSKDKYAKHIVPILMLGHNDTKPYVEPFVGGGNLIAKVPASIRWGNDLAYYAVSLLDAIGNGGYIPPDEVTEKEYQEVKKHPYLYPPEYVGFLAYSCSYAGKFWGGFAKSVDTKGNPRNMAAEQVRQLTKQAVGLRGVHFTSVNYLDMQIPDGSTIYCDPPYAGTTKYKGYFDHDVFWQWVDVKAQSCRVFVSEYSAPDWCECVWEKDVTNSLTKNTGAKSGTERLFKCHKGD
jgi:DNA adenine methylase